MELSHQGASPSAVLYAAVYDFINGGFFYFLGMGNELTVKFGLFQ
jgi:hypothetical protein